MNMLKSDIDNIINSNNEDKIHFYLSGLLEKSKEISTQKDKLSLIMLILILLYYIQDFGSIESLEIGPISLKNLDVVKLFIQIVFSYILLRYTVMSFHLGEISQIVRCFSEKHFSCSGDLFIDDFNRTLMPFSMIDEINRFFGDGKLKAGCLDIGPFLFLPVALSPIVFEFLWLKPLFMTFSNNNILTNFSLIATCFLLGAGLMYIVNLLKLTKKQREVKVLDSPNE